MNLNSKMSLAVSGSVTSVRVSAEGGGTCSRRQDSYLDLLMVRLSFFSSCFMRPIAAVYLAAVSLCASSLLVLVCSASITCGGQSELTVRYRQNPAIKCVPACSRVSSPAAWRGSASPARPSRTAGCPPPGVSVRPGRWSPSLPAGPRWLSGSPGWLSGPPAGPGVQTKNTKNCWCHFSFLYHPQPKPVLFIVSCTFYRCVHVPGPE